MVWILLVLGIVATLTLIAVFVAMKARKERHEPDYRALFIMGIVFLGAGSAMISTLGVGSLGMSALGLVYMALGIANRDKWKEPPPMSTKTGRLVMVIVAGAILLLGLTIFLAFMAM